jgi:hypothetical protein
MMTIMPAYGRFYAEDCEVLEDWGKGVTFKVVGGPYIDKKDFENYCDPFLDSVAYGFDGLHVTINQGILN